MLNLNLKKLFKRSDQEAKIPLNNKEGKLLSLSNFRVRLFLVAILALLPVFGLVIYAYTKERSEEITRSQDNLINLSNIFVSENERLIDSAHLNLNILSELPEVRSDDFKKCNNLLDSILENSFYYDFFGVADASGNVICSTNLEMMGNVSNKMYFKRTMEKEDFSIGEHQVDNIAKKAVLNFGQLTRDKLGNKRVVFAALDLAEINKFVSMDALPKDAIFSLVDNNGTILVRYPDIERYIGRSVPGTTKNFLAQEKEGLLEDISLDNINRVFAIKHIQETDLYVRIGFSKDVILAEANKVFINEILLLGLVTIITFLILEIGGRQLIIRQIKELPKIDRLKDEFVSLVSHQLRSPLTSMKWEVELLQSKDFGELNERQKDTLRDLATSTEHLNVLVGELLDISRIESEKLQVNLQAVNLIEIAKDILKELNPQVIKKSLRLKIGFIDVMPNISADPLLVRQILLNLLSNAIKYTPINGTVEISVGYDDFNARVVVCDSGIGIPKEDQKRIFNRFFRASNIDPKIQGSGLGLNLAKSLVGLMKGEMGFTSEENRGATFWVTLPLANKLPQKTKETV